MSKKRDRWDSSSSSSDDEDEDKHTAKTNKIKSTSSTTTDGNNGDNKQSNKAQVSTTSSSLPYYPLHNPLLHGCRFVYDTYDRIARLSEGTYGIVWKAKDLSTNEIVALKQIKFDLEQQKSQGFPVTALREINVLLALSGHANIVSVKEMVVGTDIDKVFMVMEFMQCDLQEAMEKRKYPNVLRQAESKGIMEQILRGIEYMHTKWYMHRDMKTSNILVHNTGRIAICDLGLTRRYQDPPIPYTQLVVTLWYRAPELLFGEEKYTPAIDLWSIGCIFGELIQQKAMMQGQGELDQIDKIFSMLGPPTEESWPTFTNLPSAKIFRWRSNMSSSSKEIVKLRELFPINPPPHFKQTFLDGNGYDLLSRLLTLNPKTRITAEEALNHKYFKEGVQPMNPNFFEELII